MSFIHFSWRGKIDKLVWRIFTKIMRCDYFCDSFEPTSSSLLVWSFPLTKRWGQRSNQNETNTWKFFSIATTLMCRRGHYSSLWIVPLYDPYPVKLSVQQSGIRYHFWAFGMTGPGIEPESSGKTMLNTLLSRPMITTWKYNSQKVKSLREVKE